MVTVAADVARIVEVLDFERASVAWRTPAGSVGCWRIAASAHRAGDAAARTVLTPAVMAGEVYGQRMLPRVPAYSFQLAADRDRHVIWRDYGATFRDTAELNAVRFAGLDIDACTIAMRRVGIAELTSETAPWPLAAVVTVTAHDGEVWRLELPIAHSNSRGNGGSAELQIETGPILVPAVLLGCGSCAVVVGGFTLAYAYFNRLDRIDLALLQVTGTGAALRRSFSCIIRLKAVEIAVLAPSLS